MKRHGFLWDKLVSLENLILAETNARRGKRYRIDVATFHFGVEKELCRLRRELAAESYQPGDYRVFKIYDPKERLISAAPFRDRVVHHALVNVLEPIFERTFIHDSYASRKGKGTHAAADRCQHYARKYRYVFKADISKFFPSIDHEVLLERLARKIKDPRVMKLARRIVRHGQRHEHVQEWFPGDDLFTPSERHRGLPIGNQTSQFFANVILDPLDHFVKESLGAPGYVRYVDDFLVFADDKASLHDWRNRIVLFLHGLRLRLHPTKNVIFPLTAGIPFPWLPRLCNTSPAGQTKCASIQAPRGFDAGGVCQGSRFIRRDPFPAAELDRACALGEQTLSQVDQI